MYIYMVCIYICIMCTSIYIYIYYVYVCVYIYIYWPCSIELLNYLMVAPSEKGQHGDLTLEKKKNIKKHCEIKIPFQINLYN